MSSTVLKVLFICIGNSCRSPMAESILKSLVDNETWYVDSAAIADWNVGRSPEPRCIKVLGENGLTTDHVSRQITYDDFYKFDYIFGMDKYNMEDLSEMTPQGSPAKVEMIGTYDYNEEAAIADPYFEKGIAGFEKAYTKLYRSCQNFVSKMEKEKLEL